MDLREIRPVELRSLGLDERWLQQRIIEDPSVLGLGDLEIVSREHRQPSGGKIDFLMRDEADTFFEVEVMLGRVDESHIIRTIEYWDLERQRRPDYEHRAVIAAECITSRFFNVIRLLNRAVPLIAVQLTAFKLSEQELGLLPVTIMDVHEVADPDAVDSSERVDRAYWERKVDPRSLEVMDTLIASLGDKPSLRQTYNRHHIALGTTGRNYCWFYPRKRTQLCHVEIRADDLRDEMLASLQAAGIDASPARSNKVGFGIRPSGWDSAAAAVRDALAKAEELSKG